MVTLHFEGADNIGKSTIINKLVNYFKDTKDITLMHCKGPRPSEGEDPFVYQSRSFKEKAMKINSILSVENAFSTSEKNIVILDRSWYGEYVYGQIYRNANPERITEMIKRCEDILYCPNIVIYLKASSKFILNNDDNKSLSSTYDKHERLSKIENELKLFSECFEKVSPANFLEINVEDDNGNFRKIEDIFNEIIVYLTNNKDFTDNV